MRLIKINCIMLIIEGLVVFAYFLYSNNTLPQNAAITFLHWQFSRETGILILERIGEISVLVGAVGCLGVLFVERLQAPKNVAIPQAPRLSPQIPVIAGYGEASDDANVQGTESDDLVDRSPLFVPVIEPEKRKMPDLFCDANAHPADDASEDDDTIAASTIETGKERESQGAAQVYPPLGTVLKCPYCGRVLSVRLQLTVK